MKRMKGSRAFMALFLAVVMILGNALAGTYYIEDGNIEVHASENNQTVTQADHTHDDNAPVISNRDPGTSSANTVTIKADDVCTASVTVKDLNIDVSTKEETPAVKTEGSGNVNIELDGDSSLKSGKKSAGLQKENTGNLTINDADQDGKLEATGGNGGAGIGGGYKAEGENITINDGEVTATGGTDGAGIGGGSGAKGEDITINGGEVIATGRENGAGIGGGYDGDGCNITISGGKVTAEGGARIDIHDSGCIGAGIGGGKYGDGKKITISGGEVTATGGKLSAGIGGSRRDPDGTGGHSEDITISGGKVTANGGIDGIGGGMGGSGKNIVISGGEVNATGGEDGDGIGCREGHLTISGGEVIATGGASGGTGIGGRDIAIEGGEVTAIGGQEGAGIGGCGNQSGGSITVSGGKVIAVGGNNGAGIGGGRSQEGTDTSVSGSAQVKVAGGKQQGKWGEGAGIGDGGSSNALHNGSEIDPDGKDLTCGSIEYYAKGTKAEDIKNGTVQPIKTVDNPDIGHEYKWMYNETHHWLVCKYAGCVEKKDEAAHTPAAAVKENEKPAQAGKAGSYDEVVYCSVCHRELSRKTVTTDTLPGDKKMPQGRMAAFCIGIAEQIRRAPENGTVEADAGSFDCLTRVVFKALGERPDVTLKLQTKEGLITVPAGAGLLEKIGGKNTVSFAELKDMLK